LSISIFEYDYVEIKKKGGKVLTRERIKLTEKKAFDLVTTFGKNLNLIYDNVRQVEVRAMMEQGEMSFIYHAGISAAEVKIDG
jgi:hypothetical protein